MQGWDVEALVTVFPEVKDSWMFHYPAIKWTSLQAQAAQIPQQVVRTKGVKEQELNDLSRGLEKLKKTKNVEAVVSGAVASEYQRTRIDNVCHELGLKSFNLLWHKNQERLVREQIESGFEIILTACNALGLDANWLGRKLTILDLEELVKLKKRYGLNVAFEGGEAETFVLKAPPFWGRLSITKSVAHWHGDSGYLEIEDVRLEN